MRDSCEGKSKIGDRSSVDAEVFQQRLWQMFPIKFTRKLTLPQIDRVEIHCDPANVRSASVPRKLGFRHEATLHRRAVRHGRGA
mgnify:CR=1 FL=1